MERVYKIKTTDGKNIDGLLRGSINRPLILLVHGLCGHMNEAMHYNAARYFEKEGFSSFRFNLYSWQKANRKLHDCTLKTHGADISQVIKFLKAKGAKKIFAVGHSYGFPSILHANPKDIQAIVSWDGSVLPRRGFRGLPKITKPVKGRILDEGYLTIMGEAMTGEEGRVDSAKLVKDFDRPIKLIGAGGEGNARVSKKLFKSITQSKELTIIKGANHNFTEEGKQEELYRETVDWLKKWS